MEQGPWSGKRFRKSPALVVGGPTCTWSCISAAYVGAGEAEIQLGCALSVSLSELPQGSRLVSCPSSCGVPFPSMALNPSPISPRRLPRLHPKFGCRPLYLFQSFAGWSLSEDIYARFLLCLSFGSGLLHSRYFLVPPICFFVCLVGFLF